MTTIQRSTITRAVVALTAALGACSGGPAASPGGGTQTLTVDARVSFEDGDANVRVRVQRAGADVPDAKVTLKSELAPAAVLPYASNGDYRQTLPGWAHAYQLEVVAGADHLEGAVIGAPEAPTLTAPLMLDAKSAPSFTLQWAGVHAQKVKVRVTDFDSGDVVDMGGIVVPATFFRDAMTEVRIERENSTPLAGGTAGSVLRATRSLRTRISVTNPY